jgi:type IV pilus assembly protein PilC
VSAHDVAIFTRRFETMVKAGLPLVQSLDTLSRQSESSRLGAIVSDVVRAVEGGTILSEALGEHPYVFNRYYVTIVGAGEACGVMDSALTRLSCHLERAETLRLRLGKILTFLAGGVLAAPCIVTGLLGVVAAVLAMSGVALGGEPQPRARLAAFISELPPGTWLVPPLVFLAIASFLLLISRTSGMRLALGGRRFGIPALESIAERAALAEFSRSLGTLLAFSVPAHSALEIAARNAGDRSIEKAVAAAILPFDRGDELAVSLGEARVFPPLVVQMIAAGEATGALDMMLDKVAALYDTEVDLALGRLSSRAASIMILIVVTIALGAGALSATYLLLAT